VSGKRKCHCVILPSHESITSGVNETPPYIVGVTRVLGYYIHRISFVSCWVVRVNNPTLHLFLRILFVYVTTVSQLRGYRASVLKYWTR
jgi:hypothetical protein